MSNNPSANKGNKDGNTGYKTYTPKDQEKVFVDFRGKKVEIRRLWDSKKTETRDKLLQVYKETQPGFRREVKIAGVCIEALGLRYSEAEPKCCGKITVVENGTQAVVDKTIIKFLMNGGQVRVERHKDGSQSLQLDTVTQAAVEQCLKDANAWTQEDQAALDEKNAGMARRRADRERHESFERENVHTFSCEAIFAAAGI